MTITVPEFVDLNADTVEAFFSLSSTQLMEDNPALDASRGVLGEVLVFSHALFAAQFDQVVEQLHSARSLLAINENPTEANLAAVDDVLSNFGIARAEGTRGSGTIAIVVSSSSPVIIPAGTIFETGGREFNTEVTYTAKPSGSLFLSDTDVLLRPIGNDQYAFVVPVTASAVGAGTTVRRGSLIVPQVLPPGYITSYAAADFIDGTDTETTEAMLRRQQSGLAAKTPSNRVCLRAMVQADSQFSRVSRTSAIGCGYPEMHRDSYWIFPVGGGGRVDLYARTSDTVSYTLETVTAVRVGTATGGNAIMQFSLGRDTLSGFYEVSAIRDADSAADAGSFDIIADERSLDLTGDNVPDVQGLVDGAYSRFQAAVIRFEDPSASPPALGESREYVAEIAGLPLIAELHDFLADPARADLRADLLVRAPIPVFVSLELTIEKPAMADDPDLAAVTAAAAGVVNGVDFTGRLFASAISDAVYGVIPSDCRIHSVYMVGRCRYPSGRVVYLRDAEILEIPDAPGDCVTPRTAQFFGTADAVLVTVTTRESAAE